MRCGTAGAIGRTGTVVELAGADAAEVVTGDVLVVETPGGGGYGRPGSSA